MTDQEDYMDGIDIPNDFKEKQLTTDELDPNRFQRGITEEQDYPDYDQEYSPINNPNADAYADADLDLDMDPDADVDMDDNASLEMKEIQNDSASLITIKNFESEDPQT